MLPPKIRTVGGVDVSYLGEVGVGNMVSLETAFAIVEHCSKSRIPEPLLQAHKLVTKERIRLQAKAK